MKETTNGMSIAQAKLIVEDVLALRGHDRFWLSQYLWHLASFGYDKFEAYCNAGVDNLESAFVDWMEKEIEKETELRHVIEGLL